MRVSIELRHLRYLIAAADLGSIRRAAAALGVRESAISRRIRDLEDETGAAMLIRHSGGVHLTFAGERFVRRARRAIEQIEYAQKEVGTIGRGEDGAVRIGLFSSIASGFLARLFHAYDNEHAAVHLEFVEGEPSDYIASIRQHRLDIAFLPSSHAPKDCEVAHLWNERIHVAMPENDDLADNEEIRWSDLSDRHFVVSEASPGPAIHDYIVKHVAEPGHTPSIQRQAVYRDTLMQVVASGRGLTLVCDGIIAAQFSGVSFRPIAGAILPFYAIWSPSNDNPAFRKLLSLAKVMSQTMLDRKSVV